MSDEQRAYEQAALEKIRELEKKLETKLREKENRSKIAISAFRQEREEKIASARKELAKAKSDLEELEAGRGILVQTDTTGDAELAQSILAKHQDTINSMADRLFGEMIGRGREK